jgi:hypothetical protein
MWLMKHAQGDHEIDQADVNDVPIGQLLGNEVCVDGQVELHSYGHHDMQHFILGVRVAWATDYSSTEVDPHRLLSTYAQHAIKVRAAILKLGGPEDVKVGMYMCPSD